MLNHKLSKQYLALLLTVGVIVFYFVTTVYPKEVSKFIWGLSHIPQLALFIHNDKDVSFSIGNYYFNAEGSGVYDVESAEKYFKITLENDPSHKFVRHQLARIQFLRGDFKDALDTINEQIGLHGDEVVASYYVRGLIYGFTGEFEKAEVDFLKFIEIKPKNWGGYNDLAWIYFQKGDYRNAEKYSHLGLDISANNAWLLTTNGVSLLNLNRKEEAEETLQKALSIAKELTSSDWLNTNPGNNPHIAQEGLMQMISIIEENLELVVDK